MSKTGRERVKDFLHARWNYEATSRVGFSEEQAVYAKEMDSLIQAIADDLDTLARIRELAWPFRQHLRECDDGGYSCLSASNAATVSDLRTLLRAIGGET